jgi:protein phosphatase methylesterase 1
MGGAVVVNTVPLLLEAKYRVSGVAVLDVVEGTAIDALPHMPAVLNFRPEGFDSVSHAIEWQYVPSFSIPYNPIKTANALRSINAHQIRNITSARVSVPSLVIPTPEPRARGMRAFVWRTPLRTTGPYWEGLLLSPRLPCNIDSSALMKAGSEDYQRPSLLHALRVCWYLQVLTALTASL